MPYRYTDVNIKLHQYQCWKSGGLRVLRGFKETVLAKGKQTFSLRGRQCTNSSKQRHHSIPHYVSHKQKDAVRDLQCFCKLMQVQNVLMKQEVDQIVTKPSFSVTIAHPSVFVCWLQGLGFSLCLIQHVTEAGTLENPVTTQRLHCSLTAGKPYSFSTQQLYFEGLSRLPFRTYLLLFYGLP